MKSLILWWGVLCYMFYHGVNANPCKSNISCKPQTPEGNGSKNCSGNGQKRKKPCDIVRDLNTIGYDLMKAEVNKTTSISSNYSMGVIHKPSNSSGKGLSMYASKTKGDANKDVPNRILKAELPKTVKLGPKNKVALWMVKLPKEYIWEALNGLYDGMLIGLKVDEMEVSGLEEPIRITINVTSLIDVNQKPTCVYLNSTANDTNPINCDRTDYNESHITCFTSHLTYFGVLLVSVDISTTDAEILFYLTYIGCCISLLALIATVLLFIAKRKHIWDDSKKIHISLAVALILLNIHFLPSQAVAAMSSTELCVYVALLIHYSLLASFTWMALEGFHLYLLLVKVFNNYVKRYLFKLSLVGWGEWTIQNLEILTYQYISGRTKLMYWFSGLPAVIVLVLVSVDKTLYGRTPLISSRPNETEICYLTNDQVKMGTTLGPFSLMFLFNMIMFGVTVRWVVRTHLRNQHGPKEHHAAQREILTLVVLMVMLGLPWGLIFFSLGQLPAPGLYAFCILNSLQGFFIFIYFVFYFRKSEISRDTASRATHIVSSSRQTQITS